MMVAEDRTMTLQEISSMLVELQSLVGKSANEAGVSQEELQANQLQIDSILQTIDRVANATSFNGTKLLDGSFSPGDTVLVEDDGRSLELERAAAAATGRTGEAQA